MADEIEAKLRVSSHDDVRERLRRAGGAGGDVTQETNTFFDTPAREFLSRDEGLRLRQNSRASGETFVVTYKGPKRKNGLFKTREEVEFSVDNPAAVRRVFEAMGFRETLNFEKRRESWTLLDCHVELDTLPGLGAFVEVEGPGEAAIYAVLKQLDLDREPLVKEGYSKLIASSRKI